MEEKEVVIWNAEFNDSVTTYWLLSGMLICIVCVVTIPVLPIWYFAGKMFTRKYLDSHSCVLTDRSLKVAKGVFTKIEKTVPLDRITDLGIVQGPIMRYFKIEAISVETAGQSAVGSLVSLAGIKDGRAFRDAVLAQRDKVVGSSEKQIASSGVSSETDSIEILKEIRDTLMRIEEKG